MLQLSKTLLNRPVMSLRTGSRVGTATEPVVNPNNLKIEGWFVVDRFTNDVMVVLSQDIRDIIPRGIIIDDHDALSKPEDLLRLEEVLHIHFNPLGKKVITNHKRRLGKVGDYAVDVEAMMIQKLYVERSILRSFSSGQLSIDRTQIIEISPSRIVVRDADEKVSAGATAPATAPVSPA
jgi:sporulation protein YlmC with PRC-barrel domain